MTPFVGLFVGSAALTEHDDPEVGTAIIGRPVWSPTALLGDIELRLGIAVTPRAGRQSWKTASRVWGVVKKMFSDARASTAPGIQVRDDDPSDRVQAPERGEEKSKAFLYPSEFLTLVTSPVLLHGEELPKHVAANVAKAARRWLRVFALGSYLGVRAGELRSLRWSDIDFEHMVVHVHVATEPHSGGKREKKTKTGITRRFAIEPNLRPLLEQLKRESGGVGRVVKVPSESDLSARLKQYLRWAGVDREELFIDDLTRCSITFKDLRATYLTWRAIRGDDPLKIQRAAGHKTLNTTQIYIRAAEDLGGAAGEPFPPLPAFVIGADEASASTSQSDVAELPNDAIIEPRSAAGPQLARKLRNYPKLHNLLASPTGFEPVYQG
jgi:integrase